MTTVSAAASSSSNNTQTTTGNTELGKEDFLKLMLAQMKNQDPLSPSDPSEYTQQLVQFSSLEQLVNMNASMTDLTKTVSSAGSSSALNLLGKKVAFYEDKLQYDGKSSAVDLGYYIGDTAQKVTVEIQKDGKTVATLNGEELAKGNHYLSWDGLTSDGKQAEAGEYSIKVTATDADGAAVTSASIITAQVLSINMSGGQVQGIVTSEGSVDYSYIIGVLGED